MPVTTRKQFEIVNPVTLQWREGLRNLMARLMAASPEVYQEAMIAQN